MYVYIYIYIYIHIYIYIKEKFQESDGSPVVRAVEEYSKCISAEGQDHHPSMRIPQSSSITRTSPSDCLVSYLDTRWWGS